MFNNNITYIYSQMSRDNQQALCGKCNKRFEWVYDMEDLYADNQPLSLMLSKLPVQMSACWHTVCCQCVSVAIQDQPGCVRVSCPSCGVRNAFDRSRRVNLNVWLIHALAQQARDDGSYATADTVPYEEPPLQIAEEGLVVEINETHALAQQARADKQKGGSKLNED